MIILHSQQNNKLAVTTPCANLDEVLKSFAGVPHKIVNTLDIKNEFFDAYEFDKDIGAVLNIEKAWEIKRNAFRQKRLKLLERLDVEYMRAVESSNTAKKKAIAAKKQEMRDVTTIDLPANVDDLVKFWPDVLNDA